MGAPLFLFSFSTSSSFQPFSLSNSASLSSSLSFRRSRKRVVKQQTRADNNKKTQNTALHRPLGLLLVPPLRGDRRRPFQDAPALRGHEGGLGPPRHPLGRRGIRARLGPFADPVPGGKLDVF